MHVRCVLCDKILKCDTNDTKNLLQHVRECHPELNIQPDPACCFPCPDVGKETFGINSNCYHQKPLRPDVNKIVGVVGVGMGSSIRECHCPPAKCTCFQSDTVINNNGGKFPLSNPKEKYTDKNPMKQENKENENSMSNKNRKSSFSKGKNKDSKGSPSSDVDKSSCTCKQNLCICVEVKSRMNKTNAPVSGHGAPRSVPIHGGSSLIGSKPNNNNNQNKSKCGFQNIDKCCDCPSSGATNTNSVNKNQSNTGTKSSNNLKCPPINIKDCKCPEDLINIKESKCPADLINIKESKCPADLINMKQSKCPVDLSEKTVTNETGDKVIFRRKYVVKTPLPSQTKCKTKRKVYRTSIERWRPGKGEIMCPCCFKCDVPIIKMQSIKAANSTFGAACILSCWPFCFLPCLFPPPAVECIHCARCNFLLGVYDKATEVIKVNTCHENSKIENVKKVPSRSKCNQS